MFYSCPAEVAYVDQTLNAGLYFYKSTEFCQVCNSSFNNDSGLPAFCRCIPGIRQSLLQAERDPVVLLVYADHLDLDVIALRDNILSLGVALP